MGCALEMFDFMLISNESYYAKFCEISLCALDSKLLTCVLHTLI